MTTLLALLLQMAAWHAGFHVGEQIASTEIATGWPVRPVADCRRVGAHMSPSWQAGCRTGAEHVRYVFAHPTVPHAGPVVVEDYAARHVFSDYGNVGVAGLGDCAEAAAADATEIFTGTAPNVGVVEAAYAALELPGGGTSDATLFSWWENPGLWGTTIGGTSAVANDPGTIERSVDNAGHGTVLFASLVFARPFQVEYLDGERQTIAMPTGEAHMLDVVGWTTTGPLLLSWGQVFTVTWSTWLAWNPTVLDVWGLAGSVVR